MTKPLRLIFCGTPQFAVPTLQALLAAGYEIVLVVSQPDRPAGRDRQLTAPPVKLAALAAGLPVTQPETIRNNSEFRAQLEAIAPDAIVVVAYGRLIPPWMLALPRLCCINLHASLRSPIEISDDLRISKRIHFEDQMAIAMLLVRVNFTVDTLNDAITQAYWCNQ